MINKDNYEEYFLLYADNELSEEERIEVEVFVKLFPELEEEFNMIKLTIAIPDENVSFDKSFLLKDEVSAFINLNNYEEIFVLYHDNELDENKRSLTERFVHLHPECKDEFELFGQAKFDSESSIVFPNKALLYKKEITARVVPIRVWRMLAAAVLIGFGVWVAVPYINPAEPETIVAINKNSLKQTETKTKVDVANGRENSQQDSSAELRNDIPSNEQIANLEPRNIPVKKEVIVPLVKKPNPVLIAQKIEPSFIEEKIKTQKTNENDELLAVNNREKKLTAIENTSVYNSGEKAEAHIDQVDPGMKAPQVLQEATYANFTAESNTDHNYVFYNVSTEEFKKSKVGGFLKMVKRMVERTNPIAQMFSGNDDQIASK